MCGRYAFDDIKDIYEARKILEEISSRLGSGVSDTVKNGEVFPGDCAALLLQSENGCVADAVTWGYPMSEKKSIIINARSESVFSVNMFNRSLKQKKCLIPCTGFFEWKAEGNRKIKYRISLEGKKLFYLAGLYDTFLINNEYKKRFVILTAAANSTLKDIHERMPIAFSEDEKGQWLSNEICVDYFKYKIAELDKYIPVKAVG